MYRSQKFPENFQQVFTSLNGFVDIRVVKMMKHELLKENIIS